MSLSVVKGLYMIKNTLGHSHSYLSQRQMNIRSDASDSRVKMGILGTQKSEGDGTYKVQIPEKTRLAGPVNQRIGGSAWGSMPTLRLPPSVSMATSVASPARCSNQYT